MIKFRQELDRRGIEWVDASTNSDYMEIHRTHFEYKGNKISVINGFGTYGGVEVLSQINHGLLEVYGGNVEEPEGWLTAEQAIKLIFESEGDSHEE